MLYTPNQLQKATLGPFIRGKIRRVLHKTRTFRINVNGTFLKVRALLVCFLVSAVSVTAT